MVDMFGTECTLYSMFPDGIVAMEQVDEYQKGDYLIKRNWPNAHIVYRIDDVYIGFYDITTIMIVFDAGWVDTHPPRSKLNFDRAFVHRHTYKISPETFNNLILQYA